MKSTGQKKLVPLPVRAARMLKRLKNVRGLSDAEKSVHALGLAATPQERWDLWEKSMRSYGLLEALEKEKIRFVVIGMSSAIAQGVIANTLDLDLWIDLPPREYMRVKNLALKTEATIAANTVVYLEDGTPVNFVYEVGGIGSFARERRNMVEALIHGVKIPVLHLTRILKSKEAIRRDEDLLHICCSKSFCGARAR